MKNSLTASLVVLLLTGCGGGTRDDPEAGPAYGKWMTEYRFEETNFRQHRCFAKTNINSDATFRLFQLIVEWDHRAAGLPYGKPASAFGMKIEPLSGKALWLGTESVSIILRFNSGFELKRTFGNIDDRGLGHIDLGPELKALLLKQINRAHSVEILSERGEGIGRLDLQGLSEALMWVDQCAIEHGG